MADETPQLDTPGPVGDGEYIVVQGDCLESIAFEAGFFWKTIWDHPRNAALKAARVSPNILLPGDRFYIPEKAPKTFGRPTDQNHVFVVRAETSKLRLCIKQVGEPRRNEPYRLEVDGTLFKGTTDNDGCIEVAIPPNASTGSLTVGDHSWNQLVLSLQLGGMDPLTEISGMQKRLQNLGFGCKFTAEMDEQTAAALALFQKGENLQPTGEIDQATIEQLKTRHGS